MSEIKHADRLTKRYHFGDIFSGNTSLKPSGSKGKPSKKSA
jgi:hypothetical protein